MELLLNRTFWAGIGLAVILVFIYLFGFRWTPETQVRLRQMALISAAERNASSRLEQLISSSYLDQWGLTKKDLLVALRELRRGFVTVETTPQNIHVAAADGQGTFSAVIRIDGIGYGAELAKSELNYLTAPFVFSWKKEGPMPWDWRLVRTANGGLETLGGYRPGMFPDAE